MPCTIYKRDLNTAFKFTSAEVKKYGELKKTEILIEVKGLIKNSIWQSVVYPSKVCNLPNGQVYVIELELLSLGADFSLQIGKSSFC